jgi:hypothetical protein
LDIDPYRSRIAYRQALTRANRVGSRPLRVLPLKANDPTLSISISPFEECHFRTLQERLG